MPSTSSRVVSAMAHYHVACRRDRRRGPLRCRGSRRRAGRNDTPIDQHRDAVGEREHRIHVVLDQEDRRLSLQRFAAARPCARIRSVPSPAIGSSSSSSCGCVAKRDREFELASARRGEHCTTGTSARAVEADAMRVPAAAAARAGGLASARPARKRKRVPGCACTASATLSSAVKSSSSDGDLERAREPSEQRAIGRQRRDLASAEMDRCPHPACSSPVSCAISVVLPAPFGPMIACSSPRRAPRATRVGRDQAAEALAQTVGTWSSGSVMRAPPEQEHR